MSCKCRCKNAGMRICKIVSGEANDGSLLSKEKLMNVQFEQYEFLSKLHSKCWCNITLVDLSSIKLVSNYRSHTFSLRLVAPYATT